MGIRGRTKGRSVALVAIGATLWVSAAVAEPKPEEKPDLDLPEVVIEGVDQSILGVGDMPSVGDPKTGALPLPDPPLADPRDVVVDDGVSRSTFDPAPAPRPPSPLTVRGVLTGGSYRTLRAGFDAMRQLSSGGIFGELGGVSSDGHLDDGGRTRAAARVGGVVNLPAGGIARGQIRYRAREQDLPGSGRLTEDLGAVGRTQTFRRWGADVRYLYDEAADFRAEFAVDVSRASLRSSTGSRSQSFLDGTVSAHAEVPLSGRLWKVSGAVAGGGRSEEDPTGRDRDRTRLDIAVTGRVGDENGAGIDAGLRYARFGDVDVFGPAVTLFYQLPPTRRLWFGVEPFLREPDLLGFFDATAFASGFVGQPAEVADFRLHGGLEWKPNPLVTVEATSGLRRSDNYAHPAVDPDRPGLYALDTLDRRYVYDIAGRGAVEILPGVTGEFAVTAEFIEGRRVPYVSEQQTEFGVHYRGRFDANSSFRYVGPMWGSPEEGSPRLDGAWLVSLGAGMELVPRTWLTIEAKNLLDDEYVSLAEYASEGRHIEAGFRYAF